MSKLFYLNNIKKVSLNIAVVLGVFCVLATSRTVFAATLSLIPSNANLSVGNIITLNVVVDTQGTAINTSDAIIQFPTDMLQVLSVSKSDSIFSLWVEDPNFSNSDGQVSFNGGITNPGFTGSSGQLISITFRAKKAGTASVLLSDSSVRANDGLGTDVLNGKNNATLTISAAPTAPVESAPQQSESVVSTTKTPSAIAISSPTHPNQDAWYTSDDAVLAWSLPSSAQSVETTLSAHADAQPSVIYSPVISKKEIASVGEGTWYFRLRYQTPAGWSAVSSYRLQIDKTAPEHLAVTTSTEPTGETMVQLSAVDLLSGMDHYTVQVDQGQSRIVAADASGLASTTLPNLTEGAHQLTVQAFDRAGNVATTTQSISVSTPVAINIISYPTHVTAGGTIEVVGQVSYPNADIAISLTNANTQTQIFKVKADSEGVFRFQTAPTTAAGIDVLWADLLNPDGSSAATSEKISISIEKPLLVTIGDYTVTLLSVLVPAVALLLLLLGLIYLGWYKFFSARARLKDELEQAQVHIHQALRTLSDEATTQLHIIEKSSSNRKLTLSEQKAEKDLREAIGEVDTYIQKLVEKIKRTEL